MFRAESDRQAWRKTYATEWRTLKKKVIKRDGNSCQNPSCNRRMMNRTILAVHHIEDASSNKSLRLDPDNLITLCHGKNRCHNNFHKWMGGFSKPCTRADLELWFDVQKGEWFIFKQYIVKQFAMNVYMAIILMVIYFTFFR